MINTSDFFIAIYTNQCKSYCDKQFFDNLLTSNIGDAQVMVVDNTLTINYMQQLEKRYSPRIRFEHIFVDRDDRNSLFQRNVAESALLLREYFLKSNCKYFVILESDVIPQSPDWLQYFGEVADQVDVIGGLYYKGFHDIKLWNAPENVLIPASHVLSGCTLYHRHIIEKFPFRWSYDNIGAFPDAWISHDINQSNEKNGTKYKLANYPKIKCDHIDKPGSMSRGQEDLI